MKILVLLLCASSAVFAESRVLPPVIDNSTYPAGSAMQSKAPSNHAMYEVLGRLEQLQLEVQQLRGVVESQSQTIDDLKKRQGNIYSDLDLRIQELAGVDISSKQAGLGASNPANAVITETALLSKPGLVKDVVENSAAPTNKSSTAPITVNEKHLYQAAYETLRNGHNARAIDAFKSLLVEFPQGEYADNAQYWLGEAYKVDQKIDSAKAAFTKVVTHYADSSKVPDALLKLGYIELEQNNMAKARDYLTQVTVGHPKTTAAHLATKKLMLME